MKIYNRINNGSAEVRDDLARKLVEKEVWEPVPSPTAGRGQASVDSLKGAGTTGKEIVKSEDAAGFWKVIGKVPAGSLPPGTGSGGGGTISWPSVHAAVEKKTPVDADEIPLIDSADGWGLKRFSFGNLKAWFAAATVTLTNKTLEKPTITGGKFDNVVGATQAGTTSEAIGTSGRVAVLTHVSAGSSSASVAPTVENSLAYHRLRGGTVSLKINGTEDTTTNLDNVFAPNSANVKIPIKAVTDTVEIEIDVSAYRTSANGGPGILAHPIVGCEGRNGSFAKSVLIEVFDGTKWTKFGEAANVTGHFAVYNSAANVTKIRWTFTNFQSATNFLPNSLFAVALQDPDSGYSGFLPRAGGALYGTVAAPPTLSTPAGVPLRVNAKDIEFSAGVPAARLVATPASASAPGDNGWFALSADETSLYVYAPKAKVWKKLTLASF